MVCRILSASAFFLAFLVPLFAADIPVPAPNSDSTYQQLRNLNLSGEAIRVAEFELKRDAGTFHLHSGTVCFCGRRCRAR